MHRLIIFKKGFEASYRFSLDLADFNSLYIIQKGKVGAVAKESQIVYPCRKASWSSVLWMPRHDCLAGRQVLGMERKGPRLTAPPEGDQSSKLGKRGVVELTLLDELLGSTRDHSHPSH